MTEKTDAILKPSGSVTAWSKKEAKGTEFYVSAEQRRLAKQKRDNRKKMINERRTKARTDKQSSRACADVKVASTQTTKTVVEHDEKDVFTKREKASIASLGWS